MGGLICRCLLQNPDVATAETRKLVDKVFTYATPHNGIEMGGINVPSLLSLNDMNNFNRKVMSQYLKVPADKANTLGDSGYPPGGCSAWSAPTAATTPSPTACPRSPSAR